MRSRWRAFLPIAAALILAGGCRSSADPPPEVDRTGPALRTSWALSHTIRESAAMRITGASVSHDEESTQVAVGRAADGEDLECGVLVSAIGQGGPDNVVGEKVATQVGDRPAIRNGAGAEFAYLMWRLEDGRWVQASCSDPADRASVEETAAAVRMKKASIPLPFDLDRLPDGYLVGSIQQNQDRGTIVYVGRLQPAFGLPDSELVISYEPREPLYRPTGRSITVQGRPAMLNEDREGPGVCVFVQQSYLCVTGFTSDTGPYPDRSGEIPSIIAIAESMTFADDLDDRSTWFAADRVFG